MPVGSITTGVSAGFRPMLASTASTSGASSRSIQVKASRERVAKPRRAIASGE
jgi:hypothetical protein